MEPVAEPCGEPRGLPGVARNRPLAPLTSLGIGGPAEWFLEARGEVELRRALGWARGIGLPVTLLGGGSNLLIADRGVRGLVVRLRGGSARRLDSGTVRAEAGMSLNALVRWTAARGLEGVEAWAGTPGTVGGAVHGNAHFGGAEIGDRIGALRLLESDGSVTTAPRDDLRLAPGGGGLGGRVVLSADFRVQPGRDPEALRSRARSSIAFRRRTQPLRARSAGCAFRNPDRRPTALPPGMPAAAGALLDRAGLKGTSVGGARVSRIHANFLLARPGTSAADLRSLLERCQVTVRRRFGVRLEPEIGFVGEFGR